jgi:hypothetical protein
MTLRMRVVGLALLGCVSACAHYSVLRTSTLQGSDPSRADIKLPRAPDDVARQVEALFQQRGFPVVNKLTAGHAVYYLFKGTREKVTSLFGNEAFVAMQSNNVGSWFVARIAGEGSGTDLMMFGKPTVNGVEVCSDADSLLAELKYWCVDTKVKDGAPEAQYMTGREEREILKGVGVALEEAR